MTIFSYKFLSLNASLAASCMITSCQPPEQQTTQASEAPISGYDPSDDLPKFENLVKRRVLRPEAEMHIFKGWTNANPALERRIRASILKHGFFHDPEVVSPNCLYRVNSLQEAEQIWKKKFDEDQDFQTPELKKHANKSASISVAYVEPDSFLFLFFDNNGQLVTAIYP